ncbi:MAG: hypothetical protein ABFS35_22715, partial [Bacteroidota bacterium]
LRYSNFSKHSFTIVNSSFKKFESLELLIFRGHLDIIKKKQKSRFEIQIGTFYYRYRVNSVD